MTTPWIVAFATLWAVVVFTLSIVLGGLRRIAPVLERAEQQLGVTSSASAGGLPPGTLVPAFSGRDAEGSEFDEQRLGRALLLFLSGGCPPCRLLAQDIAKQYPIAALQHEIVVVLNGRSELDELQLPSGIRVIYQANRSIARAFDTTATPHVFVIENGEIIGRGTPNSVAGIFALTSQRAKGGERARRDKASVAVPG
jgi:hypothetical protein